MSKLLARFIYFTLLLMGLYASMSLLVKKSVQERFQIKLSEEVKYIVIGNSHPECALNDSIVKGMSNWGKSGEALFYSVLKGKKLLEDNPQVRLICVELSINQLDSHMYEWVYSPKYMERAFRSYGFLFENWQWKHFFKKDPVSYIKANFFSDRKYLNYLLLSSGAVESEMEWGGYQSHSESKLDSLLETHHPCDKDVILSPMEENVSALQDFIQFAKMRGVEVVLIRCPTHPLQGKCWEKSFEAIRQQYFGDVLFIDFQDWPFLNEEYLDFEHLNSKGAEKFTPIFDSIVRSRVLLSL